MPQFFNPSIFLNTSCAFADSTFFWIPASAGMTEGGWCRFWKAVVLAFFNPSISQFFNSSIFIAFKPLDAESLRFQHPGHPNTDDKADRQIRRQCDPHDEHGHKQFFAGFEVQDGQCKLGPGKNE